MGKLTSTQLKQLPSLWHPQLADLEALLDETILSKAIFEKLIKVIQKWPHVFGGDLFKEAQRFLSYTEKKFRAHRSLEHQLRIICSHYQLQKKLLRNRNEIGIELRVLPTHMRFPFGQKLVMGLAIAVHFTSSYERLGDEHILRAAQKLVANLGAVKESFVAIQQPRGLECLLYLELEKENGFQFSSKEVSLLKHSLKEELKKGVETLAPSFFGLCDLEEVMRSIFSLSQELKAPSDLPQVMISFERIQSGTLIFRGIVLRLLTKDSKSISHCFSNLKGCEFVFERSTVVGYTENEEALPKEASVFRLHIPKAPFLLRCDSSCNLFYARHYVVSLITEAIGEIRDYNGGVFAKQLELFTQFKTHFKEIADKNPELLENFFHNLSPPEMQAILPFSSMVQLFNLYLEALSAPLSLPDGYILKSETRDSFVFVVIRLRDRAFQKHIVETLSKAPLAKELTCSLTIKDTDGIAQGYIYDATSEESRSQFLQILENTISSWLEVVQSTQVLRLCPQHLPFSLDPRLGGDELSTYILKMLFEGLTRIGKDGKVHLAIAEALEISADEKTYTFLLKESIWNNGDPVTAYDFCYTWKKILSPHFKSAFTNLFYIIRHAKKAKEGLISVDEVGIKAVNDTTLVVELEHPCAYFLELTSHPLFSPVNHRIDQLHPNWFFQTGDAYVCNGPFQLEYADGEESYELKKSPFYWDAKTVKLDRVQITRASAQRALEMFDKGEIDWIGRPIRAWEPFFAENKEYAIEKVPVSSTYWYVLNVNKFPFHSQKMRFALSQAIDRQAVIDILSYEAIPALTPLPLPHSRCKEDRKGSNTVELFEEALIELGITRKNFPPITLFHANNDLRRKIALNIAQQWKDLLGIVVKPEPLDFKDLFTKMTRGDFQIGVMSWRPWIDDPIYTLNAFKYAGDQINFSGWESPSYQSLIEKADRETNLAERDRLFAAAEAILIREKPVIPIFHEIEPFIRKNYVEGISPSKIGNIDFKYVHINRDMKYPKSV
ncbi:MAG: peptide ABC transporter substrate-binding protein [Verrucomicrobia bacterium]|nr:peptide ABC transporter substrate-binding protein [Verrucomicrobiota bacterium]